MKWVKSSKCEQGACVEVSIATDCTLIDDAPMIAVRNSEVPGEIVWFTLDEWQAFTEGVKAGEFSI